MNREDLERLVSEEQLRRNSDPYLIAPVERPAPHRADPSRTQSQGLFPMIACVGRFSSFQPARDESRAASELTIIWFQDEFAFPINPGIREQIRTIEWEKHAYDFDW
jgi:hypothetical protein